MHLTNSFQNWPWTRYSHIRTRSDTLLSFTPSKVLHSSSQQVTKPQTVGPHEPTRHCSLNLHPFMHLGTGKPAHTCFKVLLKNHWVMLVQAPQ